MRLNDYLGLNFFPPPPVLGATDIEGGATYVGMGVVTRVGTVDEFVLTATGGARYSNVPAWGNGLVELEVGVLWLLVSS